MEAIRSTPGDNFRIERDERDRITVECPKCGYKVLLDSGEIIESCPKCGFETKEVYMPPDQAAGLLMDMFKW